MICAISKIYKTTNPNRNEKGLVVLFFPDFEKKRLPELRTYTVEQIAAILNIGRTTAYHLVKQENFKIVRIGNAIRISKKSFDEWLENMEL